MKKYRFNDKRNKEIDYVNDVFFLSDFTRNSCNSEHILNTMFYDQLNYWIKKELDSQEGECIKGVYYEGKTKEEVAKYLDVHITTVYRKLRSGRERLLALFLNLNEGRVR